jgi:protein phosphatase
MDADSQSFRTLYAAYSTALSGDVTKHASQQTKLILPHPDPSISTRLFRHVHGIFREEPILLELHSPVIIIGDIHGQILDLFRILNTYGNPGCQTYLFLGDLVDRGEFSIEALLCVFLLKAIWPDSVYVIRGNHEFSGLCSQCGFMAQVQSFFGSTLFYNDAIQVFPDMPLAARIDDDILCVHGGIGPQMFNLQSIANIERPVADFGDTVIDSLVWSDPNVDVSEFEESATRGPVIFLGKPP